MSTNIEDLFATVRLDTHFVHLVGNNAEKAYGNRTNRNCVVWTSGMACPMTHLPVPDLPSTYDGEYKKGAIIGCHCPMRTFETPELYVAHFNLYHINTKVSKGYCTKLQAGVGKTNKRCTFSASKNSDL